MQLTIDKSDVINGLYTQSAFITRASKVIIVHKHEDDTITLLDGYEEGRGYHLSQADAVAALEALIQFIKE